MVLFFHLVFFSGTKFLLYQIKANGGRWPYQHYIPNLSIILVVNKLMFQSNLPLKVSSIFQQNVDKILDIPTKNALLYKILYASYNCIGLQDKIEFKILHNPDSRH